MLKQSKTKLTYSSARDARTTAQPEILCISLDYDGCGEQLFIEQSRTYEQKDENDKKIACLERDFFKDHLTQISANKETVLYVGSNRQDCVLDAKGETQNGNGSCFKNFASFASAMKWEFNKILLADIHSKGIEKGLSISNADREVDMSILNVKNFYSIATINIHLKINILCEQMKDASAAYPDKKVVFVFYDDDCGLRNNTNPLLRLPPSIFIALKFYFTQYPAAIPKNIDLYLRHYDAIISEWSRKNGQELPILEYWNSTTDKASSEDIRVKRLKPT